MEDGITKIGNNYVYMESQRGGLILMNINKHSGSLCFSRDHCCDKRFFSVSLYVILILSSSE